MGDVTLYTRTASWNSVPSVRSAGCIYIMTTNNIVSETLSLFDITVKISWDIESNPGPSDENNNVNSSYISLSHLNARSLKSNIEYNDGFNSP